MFQRKAFTISEIKILIYRTIVSLLIAYGQKTLKEGVTSLICCFTERCKTLKLIWKQLYMWNMC